MRPYLANRAWYTRRSCAVVCGCSSRAYTNRPRAYTKQNTKNHIWLQTLAPDVGGVAERATRNVSRPVLLNIRFPCVSAAVTSSAATCGSAKVLFSTTRCQARRGRRRQGFLCESRPSERHGAADWSPSRGNGFSARAGRSQAPGWRVDCQAQS